jgi:hypothetical protein
MRVPLAAVRLPQASPGGPVRDGWLRFKLNDADYRQLASEGLSAIVTVDREAAQILGVRFLT